MATTSVPEPQISEAPPTNRNSDRPSTARSANFYNGPALVTLLFVQIVLGYEWLASGVTKVASGNFVSGMAGALKDKSQMASHWYQSFINSTIIPYSHTYAVLLEVGEVLVGLGFIGAAIIWLRRWPRLSDRGRMWVLLATMLAALGGTVMAVNFHLLNGGNHPWLIPKEGFDETIDLDMFMTLVQAGYFVFCGYLLVKIRREHRAASTAPRAPAAHSAPTAAPAATAHVAPTADAAPTAAPVATARVARTADAASTAEAHGPRAPVA